MAAARPEDRSNAGIGWSKRRKAIVGTIVGIVAALIIAALITISYLTSPAARNAANGGGPGAHASSTSTPSATPIAVPTSAPIAQPGAIAPGLTAQITKFEAVQGVANTPGEVSGPSVRITVTITNNTSASASLKTTTISASYGTKSTPALELFSPGGVSLPSTVADGQSVTGVYLFSIPVADRSNVRVELDYSVGVKPLVFEGAIPQ